jgi:HTH-type transcriptional regulator / antitoxin HipB
MPNKEYMKKGELAIPVRNSQQLTAALRRYRKLKNLTQEGLGASAGVPQTTVSKVEVGLVDPTTGTLFKILAALDLEVVIRPRRKAGDGWLSE